MTGTWLSPIGLLIIEAQEDHIVRIAQTDRPVPFPENCPLLEQCREELSRYFSGELRSFRFPIRPKGTDFQQKIWRELQNIPYGQTRSYAEIALRACGSKKYARAAAQAAHKNPILLAIPCHRMIGSDGSLTGFAAGLNRKESLLELERSHFTL